MADGIMKMNLAGLDPAMAAKIKQRAEHVIRAFNGAPENVAEFNEAQRILQAFYELDAEASRG